MEHLRSGTKVLIVEDKAIIARDIEMQLVRSGFEVTGTAATAAEAFELIENETPNIILMDISIRGEMDGTKTICFACAARSLW
jgi:CheY-like chemotaxis protein